MRQMANVALKRGHAHGQHSFRRHGDHELCDTALAQRHYRRAHGGASSEAVVYHSTAQLERRSRVSVFDLPALQFVALAIGRRLDRRTRVGQLPIRPPH